MNNKHIAIVVSAMNMGGAQRVVSILSRHWIQQGHKVSLICTFTGEHQRHFDIDKDIDLEILTDIPYLSRLKIINLLWKLFHLRRNFQIRKPDLAISFLARVNAASAVALLGQNIPLVICERTWPPFASLSGRFHRIYKKLLKATADRIVVQTEKSRTWIIDHQPGFEPRVIPNPVLFPLIQESANHLNPKSVIRNGRRFLLASGRLHTIKQFDVLIEAFSSISDSFPDWDLIILGEGEKRAELESLTKKLSLEERVFLPGKVGNIAEWYEKADIFVLSSVVEGFPNVLLEAMSYGLPVVSFDCDTGPRDIIEDGINGLLVRPEDKQIGLSAAMRQILMDERYRAKLGDNAKHVRDTYSIKRIMELWDDLLEMR